VTPDPDVFLRAALRRHFPPETGSPFRLSQARNPEFDRVETPAVPPLSQTPTALGRVP
jgi:hypothetical protein